MPDVRMVEYLNPQPYAIQLASPDKKIIKIPARAKVVLSEWYMRHCPKYLRVIRILNGEKSISPKEIPSNIKYNPVPNNNPSKKKTKKFTIQNKAGTNHSKPRSPLARPRAKLSPQVPNKLRDVIEARKRPIVGRQMKESSSKLFEAACQNHKWQISNNIGVGILSFNRLSSLQRLINSIRRYTDLSQVTVFVSDESTDEKVSKWLKAQTDIIVLTDQPRLGIAGNSNRLLHCLKRFKHKILLNDDVEILSEGWERYYKEASRATGYHHFCYHQPGVYGAKLNGQIINVGGYRIEKINEKPHGAVMFFTHQAFEKVGYFDEQFGWYGYEHVDWSDRISNTKIQPAGFLDVIGANRFFKIHAEKSVVPERGQELAKARVVYEKIKSPTRIRVEASNKTKVPSISVIVPIRNHGRQASLETVVNAVRGWLYPNIEIIVVEQDQSTKINVGKIMPCKYLIAKNKYPSQPFTKSLALNIGITQATYNKIIFQDADIICPGEYAKSISELLDEYDGAHIGAKVLYLTAEGSEQVQKTGKIDESKTCNRAVGYFEGGSLACTKAAYRRVGGFNEIFEGYGIEDCDFFDRLKYGSNFFNTRTVDFIHLYHGRTSGWETHHKRNKKLYQQLRKQYKLPAYITSLVNKLKKQYPNL